MRGDTDPHDAHGHAPARALALDLLHPGHVYFLTEAKKLGDELVVVVARDQTARRLKREPYVPEHIRREMVEALKPVDRAVLGSATDIYETVLSERPNILALGHDQVWNEHEVESECARRGVPEIGRAHV